MLDFSETEMKLEHAGKNYGPEIAESSDLLRAPFGILLPEFLLPFNPVTSCPSQPARIAFFGFNAYCDDDDYANAQKERNFTELCQRSYNPKLFTVMSLWRKGLASSDTPVGSIYFTNFIKLVLRKKLFQRTDDVERALKYSPACVALFENIAHKELMRLKSEGCKVFICFGWAVFRHMKHIATEINIQLIREYHYSRYSSQNTARLISEYAVKI